MNHRAMARCLVVLALALLLPIFAAVPVVRADQLRQRWMLPQNTPQFIHTFFNDLSAVAVDGQGNVYVADSNNYRIQKFDSSGGYLGQWGSCGNGNGQFKGPVGVAVDGLGNVYVVD